MGRTRKSGATDDEIVAAYERTNSAFAVERELSVGASTIYRVLAKRGISPDGLALYRQNARRFTDDECQSVRAEYEAGANFRQLMQKHGVTEYTIKKAIRRAGGKLEWVARPAYEEEDKRIVEMYESGLSQFAISVKISRSQSFVSRRLRIHGYDARTDDRSGANHGMFKTGRIVQGGYVRVLVARDDPMASMRASDGYVLEHRLVMARHLGRLLRRTETVHHKDGNPQNNDPSNLQLRQGKHGKHVVMRCADCGSHNIVHAEIAD